MKKLFIHLSDIHIIDEKSIPIDANIFTYNLKDKVLASDTIFIIFSGDFTRWCGLNQLQCFESFFDSIIASLKKIKSDIKVIPIIVPGNHDIDLSEEKTRGYIFDGNHNYSVEDIDNFSNASLSKMKDTIKTCQKYNCFLKNGFVDEIVFEDNDIIYHFHLINSAPLSSLNKKDKDHHHIPSNCLELNQKLVIGKKTIEIMVSHHRIDWFDDYTIEPLKRFLENKTSFGFFGHEHENKEYYVKNSDNNLLIMQAGELVSKNRKITEGVFSIIEFDEEKLEYSTGEYSYSYIDNSISYVGRECGQPINYFEPFKLSTTFIKSFFASPLKSGAGTIDDLFVMPSLYQDNKTKFRDFNSLIEHIKNKKKLYINGSVRTGKTIFLKKLFLELRKMYVPLYLECNANISPIIKNAIEDSFYKQYDNPRVKYAEYNALTKEKRIILLDNIHKIKNSDVLKKLFDYANEHFDIVIATYIPSFNPERRIIEEGLMGVVNTYDMVGFTYSERRSFIKKICNLMNVNEENQEKVIDLYESTIGTSKILDFTDPDYGMMLVEEIIANESYRDREKTSAFSIVFSDSINNSFKKANCGTKLDDCINLTSWLAWELWKKEGDYSFDEDFVMSAFNNCKNYYGTITIPYHTYFECLCESQIITHCNENKYRFRRLTYLSFFVGNQIAVNYKGDGREDIKKLLNNINDRINSDVLLFVSYKLSDKSIFNDIKNILDSLFSSYEEINLNKQNNNILIAVNNKDVQKNGEFKDKDAYIKEKDDREKKQLVKNEYDSVNSEQNEASSDSANAFKMLEVLSKAISGFGGVFSFDERTQYVRSTISCSLRLVQYYFTINDGDYELLEKTFEENKAKIIDEIEKEKAYDNMLDTIKGLTLKGILYSYLINVLQIVELTISDWMASGISINFIDKLDDEDYINSFIKMSVYMHMSNFDKFKNQVVKVKKLINEKPILRHFYSPIINLYLVKNFISRKELNDLANILGVKYESLAKLVPYSQLIYSK